MTDTNDRDDRPGERRPAEGVRIIPADEAQKALEAGQASGRRPEDELRFGDVPPSPSGPRPTHRFPLPDSMDPAAAVPMSPVIPPRGESPVIRAPRASSAPNPAPEARIDDPPPPEWGPTEGVRVLPPHPDPAGDPVTGSDPAEPAGEHGRQKAYDPALPLPGLDDRGIGGPDDDDERADDVAEEDPTIPGGVAVVLDDEGDDHDGGDDDGGDDDGVDDGVGHDRDAPGRWDPDEPTAPPAPSPAAGPVAGLTGLRWADPDLSYRREEPEQEPLPWASGGADPTVVVASVDEPVADRPWSAEAAQPVGGDEGHLARYDEPPPPEDPPAWWSTGERSERSEAAGDRPAYLEPPAAEPPAAEPPAPGVADASTAEPTPAEEGITVTGATELPHWTEPPAGDLPASLSDRSRDDDLDAWNALGGRGVRWRSEHDDWEDADPGLDYLAGDDTRVGALDQTRSEESDLYSFDEAFERLEEERSGSHPVLELDDLDEADPEPPSGAGRLGTATRRVRTTTRPHAPRAAAPRASKGLGGRVGVGVGLAALLVIAYVVGSDALVVLSAAVVVACAAESYSILQHLGGAEVRSSDFSFRPATLLGLAATAGLLLGGYWRGPSALPVVLAVTFVAVMLWYLLRITDARPLANIAVTVMTVLWVGLLGSFAGLLLREPRGKELFFGAVAVTVLSDIGAFVAGRRFGHRPMAPRISPGKTMEGLVAGVVVAIVVGGVVGKALPAWGGIKDGLLLGVVVAVLAPVGDLFESLIKRDLEVKDSGTVLAGHGGLLDRFDSILIVLPAAYYLAVALHLA